MSLPDPSEGRDIKSRHYIPARAGRTLQALQQTFSPPGCAVDVAVTAVKAALLRLPADRLSRLLMFLAVLESPALGALLVQRPVSFSEMDQATRERLLRALADSPLPDLRAGFSATKRLCLFMAYAATDAQGHNPLWNAMGYPGPRADAPTEIRGRLESRPLPPDRARANEFPSGPKGPPLHLGELDADVVVVGSGAGGGVAAATFALAGRKVVVLEAGPNPQRLTQLEMEMMGSLYLESALASTDDLSISLLAGACVGGGTFINWATSLRLPGPIAAQWTVASGGIDCSGDLAAHYDAVSSRLGLAVSQTHNPNNAAIVRGCKRLGWHVATQPRNATGCGDGCGYCGFGCSYGCKRSTTATYLHDAVTRGAQIIADARVQRVLFEGGRVRGVEVLYSNDGARRSVTVRAPLVVLCAGALRTPGILARSGCRSPHLGQHLRLHPTTAIFAEFDEPVEPWHGPMQTAYSEQFANLHDHYGARFEAAPAHPGLAALAFGWRTADQHAAVMSAAKNAATLIVLTRDQGEGRLTLDNRNSVQYRMDARDAARMLHALGGVAELAFAAGAKRVMTLHADPLELRREAANQNAMRDFHSAIAHRGAAPNRLGLFSAHQMGTCRMHRDPKHGVVDEYGTVHGVRGLIVADGSVFPLSSGVNPMLTIMALARRTCQRHATG